jgi:acyl dehydratase
MELGRLSRHQLALYCGGSGDHNPLHTDIDFARNRGGLGDVIGHGMLTMAMAGRVLSHYAPPEALRSYAARFVDKTQIGELLSGQAVIARRDHDVVELSLRIFADNRLVMTGSGVIALD